MINTEQKASKGMMKFVLTIFVIAIIVAVAYLVLFTPGQPFRSAGVAYVQNGSNRITPQPATRPHDLHILY